MSDAVPPSRIRVAGAATLFLALAAIAGLSASAYGQSVSADGQEARQILDAAGTKGGLVVHLGCGDGKLTAALRANDRYLVHGLDADAGKVAAARKHVQSLGLYGPVSVATFDGSHLPYVDNLVNLVVAENLGKVPTDEVLRVLAPLGVAYLKQGGQWTKTSKPWPKEIDEWQQYLHDADNNGVAQDAVVGPPRRLQWIAEPGLKSSAAPIKVERIARLEKGPAFAEANPQSPIPNPSDWPTYRHDGARSGATKAKLPAELKRHWETKLATAPSAPVVAAGKVFVAEVDAHTVSALDASDGRVMWRYTAGSRVDSPPTYHQGLVLFGSRDGWVYCLRASDGALAWRFRDLPENRLRHQAFTPDLSPLKPEEVTQAHLIPSPGFLEAISHHRSFWTIDTTIRYDNNLPQGNNPHGDLLVTDGKMFYETRGYPPGRTIVFDPRVSGYTLFAGEYAIPRDIRGAAKTKKKQVISRSSLERWSGGIPVNGKAMALADNVLLVAGTPLAFPADDLHKAYEGRMGGILWAASAETGKKAAEYKLDAPPVWDGMAAANGRLYLSLKDGRVLCMHGETR